MARKVTDISSSLGRVVAGLPAGEAREGQVKMAAAVGAVLRGTDHHRHLAVAAGTGTGKSLAYLVPAILSGKRVVVATATKGLQDQLATKDLPLVASGLRRRVDWAVLKGRSNYLCRQRLVEMEALGKQEQMEPGPAPRPGRRRPEKPNVTASLGEQLARLLEWSTKTLSGDRAELAFEPQPAAWSRVSVSAEECPGAHRCPSGSTCYAERARTRAAQAQIVIVNHHLLGADLASEGAVLPEHEALIVDEAHDLEDIIAACLGVDLSAGRMRAVAAMARGALTGAGAKLTTIVDELLEAATGFEAVLTEAPEARLPPGLGPDLGPVVVVLASRLRRLESQLRSSGASPLTADSVASEVAQRCLRSLLAVERCRQDLELCSMAGDDTVVWVAGGERRALRSAPLDVSEQLRARVFSEIPVVLTSATMAPGLAVRLGAVEDEVEELDVGSPFDYEHNALIYCAVGLPDRRRPGSEAKLHDELESLILAAGGRTLGLFTSHRSMGNAASALRPRVPWPIHVQGDMPKPALVAAFTDEDEACLFATMGFWQGVDVPGATLSLVVLDKIPFPRPDEPLMQARREAAGAEGFMTVDLPRAATLLAQGAGRLIRSATDRGVVAVLDPRLATASYSGYLVKALPRMRRTRERHEALGFLQALRAEGAAARVADSSSQGG
ncbi:MAG: ATP-dependent DNA helicase [Acidimicrobiales bacterium]